MLSSLTRDEAVRVNVVGEPGRNGLPMRLGKPGDDLRAQTDA